MSPWKISSWSIQPTTHLHVILRTHTTTISIPIFCHGMVLKLLWIAGSEIKGNEKFTFLGKIRGFGKKIQTVMTTVIWISIFSLQMLRLFWIYGQIISYTVHFPAWKKLQVYALTMMPACGGSDGCVCVCMCVSQSFQILNQLTDFHKTMYECDDTWGYLHVTLFNFVHSNVAKYVILCVVSGTELRVLKWSTIIDLKKTM
jgi:hypothetical protein